MSGRSRQVFWWSWVALVTVVTAIAFIGDLDSLSGPGDYLGAALPPLFTALGAVIALRQPGNRVAWLLLIIGSSLLVVSLINLGDDPPTDPALSDYLWLMVDNFAGVTLVFFPVLLLPFLFPTGDFYSRRHAWPLWLGMVMVPATFIVSVFSTPLSPSYTNDEAWFIDNPIGFMPAEAADLVYALWAPVFVALALGGIWSLTVRYRRSSALVRAQVRWILFASAVMAIGLLFGVILNESTGLWGLIASLAFAALPVAITIAITRYRLFEIDRIISRTISYALVVGLLAVVFAAGAIWIPTRLGLGDSALLVAVSTLAVAALFNPLRKRIQRGVDRRFNRSRIEGEHVSHDLAARLRDSLTTEELAGIWVDTVDDYFQPARSGVWLRRWDEP